MTQSGTAALRKHWPTLAMVALLAVCAVSYVPALSGGLLFDDRPLLEATDCWHGLDKIPAMFGMGEPNQCSYRPVRYVSYAIDYAIGGATPLVLHISNLIYHLLTAVVVFLLFRRWSTAGAALLMTGLWALHPVHTDSVAYISGRRDIVSSLLFVLAYLQLSPPHGKSLGVGRIVTGVVLFVLALRAKEMAVTLPVVLLWSIVVTRAGTIGELKSHVKRYWPLYVLLFAGAAAFVVYRAFLDPHSYMQGRWWGGSPATNFATVFSLYAHYVGLVVWPAELIGDYFPLTIPLARSFAEPMVLLGIGIYIGLFGTIVLALRRRWTATAFGVGWFLITMLPISHIIPHHELFAEHYLYLPMMGLALAGLPLVEWLLRARRARGLTVAFLTLVMLAYAGRTFVRSADFQSERTFYSAVYEQAPYNLRNTHNLGIVYLEAGECERALPLLLRSSRFIRRNASLSRANIVRFLDCAEGQDRQDVVDSLARELLRRNPADPLGMLWRARRSLEVGEYDRAAEDLMSLVEMERGENPETVSLLARAHNGAGRHGMALGVLRQYPHEDQAHCEQEVRALVGLGDRYGQRAFRLVQECLPRYRSSAYLLEIRDDLASRFSDGVP